MVTYDGLNVLISFGIFLVASLTLVLTIILLITDKKTEVTASSVQRIGGLLPFANTQ
jgi:hypothetical protein